MKAALAFAFLLAGTGALVYGAWLTYQPAGYVVLGFVAIYTARVIHKDEHA